MRIIDKCELDGSMYLLGNFSSYLNSMCGGKQLWIELNVWIFDAVKSFALKTSQIQLFNRLPNLEEEDNMGGKLCQDLGQNIKERRKMSSLNSWWNYPLVSHWCKVSSLCPQRKRTKVAQTEGGKICYSKGGKPGGDL